MNKSYFVVITRDQIVEVKAPSEQAAMDAVEAKLKQENPRDIFKLQVAQEIIPEENNNE